MVGNGVTGGHVGQSVVGRRVTVGFSVGYGDVGARETVGR